MCRLLSAFFCIAITLFFIFFPKTSFAYYNNMPASVVLGQPDFGSNSANQGVSASSNSLNNPIGISTDGVRLFVTDYGNNRVLIWNSIPTKNGTPADVVVGQPDFSSTTSNNGGISASSLNSPHGVFSDGTHLVVNDGDGGGSNTSNHRVLIWNSIPTRNNQPADVVVGQPDFVTGTLGHTASKFYYPFQSVIYQNKLIISDTGNSRILIYNSIPKTNGAAADVVVGQPDFTTSSVTGPTACRFGSSILGGIRAIAVTTDGKLIGTDNYRILIWNSIPTTNSACADIVLGQPDFTTLTNDYNGPSCSSIKSPEGIAVTKNNRLIVGDYGRVSIWNNFPNANNVPADLIIGQPNCTSRIDNYGGLSASSLSDTGGN